MSRAFSLACVFPHGAYSHSSPTVLRILSIFVTACVRAHSAINNDDSKKTAFTVKNIAHSTALQYHLFKHKQIDVPLSLCLHLCLSSTLFFFFFFVCSYTVGGACVIHLNPSIARPMFMSMFQITMFLYSAILHLKIF